MAATAAYVNVMYAALKPNSYTNDTLCVYARVLTIRNNRFVVVRDYTNSMLQLHVCEGYTLRKSSLAMRWLRAGDLVSASGIVYKDKQNNVSILAKSMLLVSKCDRNKLISYSLKRERMCSVALKVNVVWELRRRLLRLGYVEVETPILHSLEPTSVNPFVTRYDWRKSLLQLRVSPEFFLKSYMCADVHRGVFEFAKSFRNEGGSVYHLREFSLLELYCVDLSWEDCLSWLKSLFNCLCTVFNRNQPSQQVFSYCELIRVCTGYRVELVGADDAIRLVRLLGISAECYTWAAAAAALFDSLIVNTNNILYVLWYPVEFSPFSRAKWRGSRFSFRFEVYWNGVEIVNACVELSDFIEQSKRCNQISNTLLESLSYGLGYVLGLGIGVDRLAALLFNKSSLAAITVVD
ncbi:Lysine-tRNA ligase [Candidatus Hodgkinia cicadicola]|nr:Lysine-tRNA ligase [Candidatus Hodgkinia cicadicola]